MTKSADLGYLPAIIALGTIYDESGSNPSKAAEQYQKAINRGSHFAEYLLGRLYFTGAYGGSRRDGEKWLQAAADEGNPFAAYLLGELMLIREAPADAVRWFRVASEQGLPYAQFRLAKLLLSGRVPINKREAYMWLYVAREAGIDVSADLSWVESDLGSSEAAKAKVEARDLNNKVRRAAQPTRCKGWTGELDGLPAIPPFDIQPYCE